MLRPLVCLAALLIVCAPAAGAQEQKRLARIALPAGPEALPALIAVERGYFDQEGVIVSLASVTDMGALTASLAAGSTDAAAVSNTALLALASLEAPATAIAAGGLRQRQVLVARAGLGATPMDVAAMRLGVVNGSCGAAVLPRLLDAWGVPAASADIRAVSAAEAREGFLGGELDALFGHAAFTGADGVESAVIAGSDDVAAATGFLCADVFVASNRMLESEPELADALARGWTRGLAHIRADPQDAARVLQIHLHRHGASIAPDSALAAVAATEYGDPRVTADLVDDTVFNAWGVVEAGLLPAAPPLEGYFDPAYADRAWATLNAASN